MRLNKYQKQAIVSSIMNDVPKPDDEAIKAKIQALLVSKMPPELQTVYQMYPTALRAERHHYCSTSYSLNLVVGNLRDKDVREILQPFVAEKFKRDDAQSALKGAIESCNTLKQLEELLPEFKKYFPAKETPTKNLPAVSNVVADLSKLGWPKEKS